MVRYTFFSSVTLKVRPVLVTHVFCVTTVNTELVNLDSWPKEKHRLRSLQVFDFDYPHVYELANT